MRLNNKNKEKNIVVINVFWSNSCSSFTLNILYLFRGENIIMVKKINPIPNKKLINSKTISSVSIYLFFCNLFF